jgi:hypothetical protein
VHNGQLAVSLTPPIGSAILHVIAYFEWRITEFSSSFGTLERVFLLLIVEIGP